MLAYESVIRFWECLLQAAGSPSTKGRKCHSPPFFSVAKH